MKREAIERMNMILALYRTGQMSFMETMNAITAKMEYEAFRSYDSIVKEEDIAKALLNNRFRDFGKLFKGGD